MFSIYKINSSTLLPLINKFGKKAISISVLTGFILLTGCATPSLKAPCPDFGSNCDKTPINSWNSNY